MLYEIYLPWPPSVNSYYVKTRRGVFISTRGRQFRKKVVQAVMEQAPDVHITDRMLIEVVLYPPTAHKNDLGNYDKALLDSLTLAGFWEDDSLVDQQFFYRGEKHGPDGQVFLRVMDAAPVLRIDQKPPMD